MAQFGKLVARFKSVPADFAWNEMVTLLEGLGYTMKAPGKTGGSRRTFTHPTASNIHLHKPHSRPLVAAACRKVLGSLKKDRLI